jgi:hypothetical protein
VLAQSVEREAGATRQEKLTSNALAVSVQYRLSYLRCLTGLPSFQSVRLLSHPLWNTCPAASAGSMLALAPPPPKADTDIRRAFLIVGALAEPHRPL